MSIMKGKIRVRFINMKPSNFPQNLDSESSTSTTSPKSTTGLGLGIFLGVVVVIVAVGAALKFRKRRRNNMEKSARLTDLEQVDFEE